VARAALTKLATETTSLRHRLEAADALAKQRGARMLLEEWAKGNALVRSLAPTCFHAMGVRALGDSLTALKDEDPQLRAAGAVALGSIGRGARLGVPKLVAALSDESPDVRREAARALGNIGMEAQQGIMGLLALAMRDKTLTLDAIQAMTRISIDAQLRARHKPAAGRLGQLIDAGHVWLRLQEKPSGGWGGGMTDALVLLCMIDGGITDVNRAPMRRAMRRLVVRYMDARTPPPLVAALLLMAWRETRDPLYLHAGNRLLGALEVKSTDSGVTSNLHALALKQAQWCGESVDANLWESIPPTEPVLLGRVLRPGRGNPVEEAAEAERMAARPLRWKIGDPRWEPRYLVREAWALNLAGGAPRERYQKQLFQAVFTSILPAGKGEPSTAAHWEPPGDVGATPVSMTAAIISVLRMYADQYPPRRLKRPSDGKQKAALSALAGALRHSDPAVRAYAQSMVILWE
jgi:hypothetical protein